VRPTYQTRIGDNGNCFAACLASILEMPLPEFGLDDEYWGRVDKWLVRRGLTYKQVPLNQIPHGWSTIEGISPRGGMHACVAYDGVLKFDPHPPKYHDGQGLVEPKYYGVLEPLGAQDHMTVSPVDGSLRYGDGGFKQWASKRNGTARDGKAAELLRNRHDEIKMGREYRFGAEETAYNTTHQLVSSLLGDTERLLAKTKLDDDHAYWLTKLQKARESIKKSEQLAKQGDYGLALATQEGAFTLAHSLIDKMRNSGRTRGRDMDGFSFGMPRSKEGALQYQRGLKKELMAIRVKEMSDNATPSDLERAKKIVRYFTEIGKPFIKGATDSSDPLQDAYTAWRKADEDANKAWRRGGDQKQARELSDKAMKLMRTFKILETKENATDSTSNNRRARLHRALDCVLDVRDSEKVKDVSSKVPHVEKNGGWGKPWTPPANACAKCGGTGTTSNGERPGVCKACGGRGVAKDAVYPKTDLQYPTTCKLCGQKTRVFTGLRGPDVYD